MARVLYSLLFWAFLFVSSLALFPVAVLIRLFSAPLDPRRRALHRFTCFWASLYTWLNPAWPVTIEGWEKLERARPCVMVANHLSLLDILVLFRLFHHFKWVSKTENFRVPVVGWNMHLTGYNPLVRGTEARVGQWMRQGDKTLADGSSIMIFSEGTRSPHGGLRAFKMGAFEIALRSKCPIQPLVIHGTANALPKRGFVLQGRHPIRLEILDPIPPQAFEGADAERLARFVHDRIGERLAADTRTTSAAG